MEKSVESCTIPIPRERAPESTIFGPPIYPTRYDTNKFRMVIELDDRKFHTPPALAEFFCDKC